MIPPNMKILLVDDLVAMRGIVRRFLQELGHTDVVEAEDGNDAWGRLVGDDAFDLVISDMDMPKMNGLTLLKKIRTDAGLSAQPFLLMTGNPALVDQNQEKIIQAGVTDYIVKPFTMALLANKLENIWA